MNLKRFTLLFASLFIILGSCQKEDDDNPQPNDQNQQQQDTVVNWIPEFYLPAKQSVYGENTPDLQEVNIEISAIINDPQDLDFHNERPNELWIINKGTESSGGTVAILQDAGTTQQTELFRKDGNAWHFMSLPTAIAFGDNGNFATTPGVYDANHNGGAFFTGPTLWSGDLDVFAQPSGGNGSHLDMLHGSPFAMGIAHEKGNAYWVYDGYHKYIVRYDFVNDHGPGNDFHSDARIHRYTEVKISRNPDAPSHMILDKESGWLYIADNGNQRVIRMNINSGEKLRDMPIINEQLAQHWEMTNVEWEVFAETDLTAPSGIELIDNRLFVGDYETGEVIVYDIETGEELDRLDTGEKGLTGLKVGPNGKLWYLNAEESTLFRIEPK